MRTIKQFNNLAIQQFKNILNNKTIQQFSNRAAFVYSKITRKVAKFLPIVALLYIFLITFIIIHAFQLDAGFPQGYAVLQDVAMVSFVEDHFPDIGWNPYWENGRPFFAGTYEGVLGVSGRFFGIGAEDMVRFASVASILLIVCTFFGIGYLFSRRILLALAVPLFLLASPIFWAYIIDFGEHSRVFSFMVFVLYIYVILYYCSSEAKRSRELIQTSLQTSRLSGFAGFARRINYHFVFLVFLLFLLFLSNLGLAVLGVVIFGGLGVLGVFGTVGRKGEQVAPIKSGLWFFAKTVGIVLGLSAFYLIPVAFNTHHNNIYPGGVQSVMSNVLFKQAYPGPHFVVLSLAGLLLLAVFMVRSESRDRSDNVILERSDRILSRDSIGRPAGRDSLQNDNLRLRNAFYLFAGLTILSLLSALGYMPFYFGISGVHIIYLITLFAVITIALGCSYLGQEAVSSRILFVAVAALTAISLQNTKTLANHRFAHPTALPAPIDAGMFDTTKRYRVHHPKEEERFLLYKKYDLFFAPNTYTLNPSPFVFDWLAIREVYLYKDRPGSAGAGEEINTDFDNEYFEKRGDYAIYKSATPIVYATNSQPVLLYAKDDDTYQKQLEELAFQGVALERVIPIRTKRWDNKAKIPIVTSVKDLKGVILERSGFAGEAIGSPRDSIGASRLQNDSREQTMAYKSSTHWEISLGRQYRGVVFKQTFDKNWKAELVEGKQKQRLPILKAGPNMMYVFLPQYLRPAKVIFTYQQGWGEKAGIFVTIGTIFAIPLFVVLKRYEKKIRDLRYKIYDLRK